MWAFETLYRKPSSPVLAYMRILYSASASDETSMGRFKFFADCLYLSGALRIIGMGFDDMIFTASGYPASASFNRSPRAEYLFEEFCISSGLYEHIARKNLFSVVCGREAKYSANSSRAFMGRGSIFEAELRQYFRPSSLLNLPKL